MNEWFCWKLDQEEDHCEWEPKACVLGSQESKANLTEEAYLHLIIILFISLVQQPDEK